MCLHIRSSILLSCKLFVCPSSIHLFIALSSKLCYYLYPSAMHTYSSVHTISIPYDESVYPSLPLSYRISLKYSVQTSSSWAFRCAAVVYNAESVCVCTLPSSDFQNKVSLCLKANAEMVPKIPICHYILLI
jgi:hypothetical protein